MRRTLQTVGIPAFQFGIFSESRSELLRRSELRVRRRISTNQNLFLKQDTPNVPNVLTLQDRVSAVGEIIRAELANGVAYHSPSCGWRWRLVPGRTRGCKRIVPQSRRQRGQRGGRPDSALNEPASTTCPSAPTTAGSQPHPGARRLRPAGPSAMASPGPVDLKIVRRSAELATSPVGSQRFTPLATLRVLMSERALEIRPTPSGRGRRSRLPFRASSNATGAENSVGSASVLPGRQPHPFAATPAGLTALLALSGARLPDHTRYPVVHRRLLVLINRQDRAWQSSTDVQRAVRISALLGASASAMELTPAGATTFFPNWNKDREGPASQCAAICVQRGQPRLACNAVRRPASAPDMPNAGNGLPMLGSSVPVGRHAAGQREWAPCGQPGSGEHCPGLAAATAGAGARHYAELDVNNLRRWLGGEFGGVNAAGLASCAGPATCPIDVTGFVVYFSRTHGNQQGDGQRRCA